MIANNLLNLKDTLSTAKDRFASSSGLTSGLSSSLTSSFQSISESATKAVSNVAAVSTLTSAVSSVTSTLDKYKNIVSNIANSVTGFFSDALCGKSLSSLTSSISGFNNLSASLKMDKYKSLLNIGKSCKIGFNSNINVSVCGKTKTINPLDAISSVSSFIKKYPSILSSTKETLLRALVRDELVTKLGLGKLGTIVQKCLIDKVLDDVNSSDYGAGPTLRSKNTLRSLLNQDSCLSSLASTPLVSKFLSNASTVSLINVLLNKDKNTTQDLIEALMTVAGQRETAIAGLASALAYAKDYNTRAKMKLVNSVFKKKSNNITAKDYISIKVDANIVLKKLDEEKEKVNPQTNDPVTEFKEINETLDIVDPNWKEDNNYYKVIGNSTMADLAERALESNSVTQEFTSNTVKTELKSEHYIAIINKFHTNSNATTAANAIEKLISNSINNAVNNRNETISIITTSTNNSINNTNYSSGKYNYNNSIGSKAVNRSIVSRGCGCC